MGQQTRTSRDPIGAIYSTLETLSQQIKALQGRKLFLQVRGSNATQDGDGGMWIDNDDNKIHYQVNGIERTISHD
ncbi:MAG TPA: hypothetical protein VF077_02975 [Nitrospiraceae bacterium]